MLICAGLPMLICAGLPMLIEWRNTRFLSLVQEEEVMEGEEWGEIGRGGSGGRGVG